MIFVTVGTQGPFDRLVHVVDAWARRTGRRDVFAQVGRTRSPPRYIRWAKFLTPVEFRQRFRGAHVIVAHAGIGTIITASELGKPILLMPRQAHLREQRNNHQVATAKRLFELGHVSVAFDERELAERLDSIDRLTVPKGIGSHASPQLLRTLRAFVTARPDARQWQHA